MRGISQRPLCPGGHQLCGHDRRLEAALRHRFDDTPELGHLDVDNFRVERRSPRLTLKEPRLAISSRPPGGAHNINPGPGTQDTCYCWLPLGSYPLCLSGEGQVLVNKTYQLHGYT